MSDGLSLLSQALQQPRDSDQQVEALRRLRAALEENHGTLAIICPTLLPMLSTPIGRVLREWIQDLMTYIFCRASIMPEQKLQLANLALEALKETLRDPRREAQKTAIQCFATLYPLYLRSACDKRDGERWDKVIHLKNEILQIWTVGSTGVKIATTKVIQRIIQAQSRISNDPRMRRTEETSLASVPVNHPFLRPQTLEQEAQKLLEELIKTLFMTRTPDLISAIINALVLLAKARPLHGQLIVTTFTNWTPNALGNLSFTQVRSVEKTLRIALVHLSRVPSVTLYNPQILEYLEQQTSRMALAAEADQKRREDDAVRKRSRIADELSEASKRQKTAHTAAVPDRPARSTMDVFQSASQSSLASFDVTSLPFDTVVDLIIANFQVITDDTLTSSIDRIRQNLGADGRTRHAAAGPSEAAPVDPLKMEVGEDDLGMLPLARDAVEGSPEVEDAGLDTFELPAPSKLIQGAQEQILLNAAARICTAGASAMADPYGSAAAVSELWIPTLARLISRGFDSQGEYAQSLRQMLFDFVTADFSARIELARLWLNEEWFTYRPEPEVTISPYETWLNRLLSHAASNAQRSDEGHKSFSQFILDLPELPRSEFNRLEDMCRAPAQLKLGFTTLRELAALRPTLRPDALDVLLSLTTATDKLPRNAAIQTVRVWAPDVQPLADTVIQFALQLLARLDQSNAPPSEPDPVEQKPRIANEAGPTAINGSVDMEHDDEEKKPEIQQAQNARVVGAQIVDDLPYPSTSGEVVRHIELLLGLCIKSPELLTDLFVAYVKMAPMVQAAVEEAITGLIRHLGASHPRILDLIENPPAGSEPLVLRVLAIFTVKGKPPQELVDLIKSMAAEKELSPRFIVPILSELTKHEILTQLPRVMTLLGGKAPEKELIRAVLDAVVIRPPRDYGTVSTNVARVQQSELLTPVELLVLLHMQEKQIGLKATIEAIGLCFSMRDVFLPEVLAASMQQIMDEPQLPTLFMRTVIQSISVHKSLMSFVSNTLLARLVTKKIWETPQLWEGFIRCAKSIGPPSFGALLQLPRDQLKDLVAKQPTLRPALKDFVIKKVGSNKARVTLLLEALGEDPGTPQSVESPGATGMLSPSSDSQDRTPHTTGMRTPVPVAR
ncbi:uncharacterized protein L969DRAFT_96650 [Mixia osmundae IAM 14324]|uniref:Symplekin n=1 Tax=Mixia osmundae (strain CBS 9802 / IAM 14324 / JCM 22182 / KY 12970) TaxID=764103 RepID=G7EB29_MIXOS|nr:uncharacterized protein L969DRAFT_96650 [Mixia osmundae IAM 14324]KEI37070.1 hypothetical protein L969DRAFT_96650 [Mixia osmundae IAM 14324]GAB00040.1 hypothetical protein E5Q_06742 [Mixia osmundae IAM 14324]